MAMEVELRTLEIIVSKLRMLDNFSGAGERAADKFKDIRYNTYTVEMSITTWNNLKPVVELILSTVGLTYELIKEQPNVTIGLIQPKRLRPEDSG